jgi:carboxyl-terminal processing protease
VFETGKVAILIDEGSASASEILSGAIQDWDRGVIIGRRSFGKGLVQRPLMLHDNSMIRLTIARYYTPTGRLIQKPYGESTFDYSQEIYNRYNNGEMMNKDSIHFPDSLKYRTLVTNRIVYGGGGIMPDFFVAMDTTYYTDYYRDIIRKGILNQFALTYVDDNRQRLKGEFIEFESFEDNFTVSDSLLKSLYAYASKEGLVYNADEIKISEDQIRLLLKAYLARDIWNTNEFYRIINRREPKIRKALELMKDSEQYQAMLQLH